MNLRSRSISVTLAVGLFTTMGVAQAERALIEPSQIQELLLYGAILPPLRAQRLTNFFNSKTNVMPRTNQLREPQHH